MGKLYIGTSGYNYKHWKETFYPKSINQKEWLKYYSLYFNSIEINATFYRSFEKEVFEKWKNQTPDNFSFVLKGPRLITHVKRLRNIDQDLNNLFESVSGLNDKLSAVLWQFPETFINNHQNCEILETFLKSLPKQLRQVFEFRHMSWFKLEFFNTLKNFNAGFVINDTKAFPATNAITSDFAYIRFHGPEQLYASSYTVKQLQEWAVKINQYRKQYDVYCFFNNDASGFAIDNANKLKTLIN